MEYLLFYTLLVRIDTTLQFTLQSYLQLASKFGVYQQESTVWKPDWCTLSENKMLHPDSGPF